MDESTTVGIWLLALGPALLAVQSRANTTLDTHVVGDSVITIASSPKLRAAGADDGPVLAEAVRWAFDIGESQSLYVRALLNVARRDNGEPNYLIAYMGQRYSHIADVFKVVMAPDYSIVGIEHSYEPTADDDELFALSSKRAACPDHSVDFVFAAPDTGLGCSRYVKQTAEAVMALNEYNVVFLTESKSTRQAFLDWLQCENLLGFGSTSHGSPRGIVLADGVLNASALSVLQDGRAESKMLYWNACNAHNSPFEQAVLRLAPYRFISGDVETGCPQSERTQKCYFEEWIAEKEDADAKGILTTCERDTGQRGLHGISGTASTPWNIAPEVTLLSVGVSGTAHDTAGQVFMDVNSTPLGTLNEEAWDALGDAVEGAAHFDITATDASGNRIDARVDVKVTAVRR